MISYSESCFYFSMFSWVYISDTSTDCCHLRCTTSARLIFCGTYHFCTGLWSIASHYWNRGVPLESSGLRFSSGRSMNIRLCPWNLPMSPGGLRLSFGRVPNAFISRSTKFKLQNMILVVQSICCHSKIFYAIFIRRDFRCLQHGSLLRLFSKMVFFQRK